MSWKKLLSCKGTVHRYEISKNTFEPLVRDLCEIQVWVFHSGGTAGRPLGEIKVVTGSNNQVCVYLFFHLKYCTIKEISLCKKMVFDSNKV